MKKTSRILLVLLFIILFTNTALATETNITPTEPETAEVTEPETPAVTEPETPAVTEPETPAVIEKPSQQTSSNSYKETTKSTNNYLKSITLDEEGLTPEFDKNTDIYYIVVPLTVKYIDVNAVPEDSSSKVSVNGNTNLVEGENVITITVTAESGNWRIYKINVTKTDNMILANANLKELTIQGQSIEFDANRYKYSIEIGETQYNLDITAITENEKATFVIEGNEDLKNGENKVVVRVTAEDETTQKEYTIYVIKDFSKVEIEQTNNYTKLIITVVCAGLFLICLIIFICKITKK